MTSEKLTSEKLTSEKLTREKLTSEKLTSLSGPASPARACRAVSPGARPGRRRRGGRRLA